MRAVVATATHAFKPVPSAPITRYRNPCPHPACPTSANLPPRGALRRWWPRGGAAPEAAAGGSALAGTYLPRGGRRRRVPPDSPPFDPAAATAALQRLFVSARQPPALLAAFAEGMCTLHGELADMGVRLRNAHHADDWEAYGRALRQLIDKYIRTIDLEPVGGARSEAEQWRDLLRLAWAPPWPRPCSATAR